MRCITLRACWILSLSLALSHSIGIAHAADPDSDHDGLSDALEISLGFDPHAVDSNMDGISDLDAYHLMLKRAALRSESVLASAGPTQDTDGDGISDFLETYGYYVQDHTLVGLKRIIPGGDWRELGQRAAVAGYPVYQLATDALTASLLAQYDAAGDTYIVDVAAAYPVIKSKFISSGISEQSLLINGTTADPGSIASIMAYLVTSHAYAVPKDSIGNPLPVYFTDPMKASTDDDPYSDRDEALGIFNAGRPPAPADDPLIAALPSIRASLVSYELTQISSTSITLGSSETHTDVVRNTYSEAESRGVTASITKGVEYEAGPEFLKGKVDVSLGTTDSWSTGSSIAYEDRDAYGTFAQQGTTASDNCFAKLGLTVKLENAGSALASDISANVNIFLGDTLWRTVPVSTASSPVTLQPQGQVTLTLLGQGTDDSCLTLEETNYLEEGGLISLETVTADATISVYDPTKQLIVQDGSWAVYQSLIQRELARLDLNVTTTSNNSLVRSFWVVAGRDGYPNLSLSVEDVLGRIYKRFSCESKQIAAVACFATAAGDIALTEQSVIDFAFFDESGALLPSQQSRDLYAALPGNGAQPLTKKFAARTVVSIVDHTWAAPQFSYLDVLNTLHSTAVGDGSSDVLVHALVRDFQGVKQVDFCKNTGNCYPMHSVVGSADYPSSGQYEISLPNYSFTGSEYLQASSVSGQTSQQTPTAFFMILGDDLRGTLDKYAQRVTDTRHSIESLAALNSNDPGKYQQLLAAGLTIDPTSASDANDARSAVLDGADTVCAYHSSSQATLAELARQVTGCTNYIHNTLIPAFAADIPVYNPLKLPLAHLAGLEQGWSGASPRSVKQFSCKLEPGQVMVGVDLGKLKSADSPTAWVRYRSFDAFAGKLSAVKELRCGFETGREKKFDAPSVTSGSDYKANIVLDVGARIGTEKIVGRTNGNVTRLCVSYRTFNFLTGAFEGDRQIDCDGSSSLQSTEADTGTLHSGNSSYALSALVVGGGKNDTFEYMRGLHVRLASQYASKPYHQLTSVGRYQLESAQGTLLTVKGATTASRALMTQPANGSDDQVWTLEPVNDREFRLVPQSYEGVVTRNGADAVTVSVNKRAADDDESASNYLQHWRVEELVGGDYLIQSVIDHKVLSVYATDPAHPILRDWNDSDQQKWHLNRVDDPTPALAPVEQVAVRLAAQATLPGQNYQCIAADVRDSKGRPRYIDGLSLQLALPSRYGNPDGLQGGADVYFDTDTHVIRTYWVGTGKGMTGTESFDTSLDRYVLTGRIRLCGYSPAAWSGYVGPDMLVRDLHIEALSSSRP